VLANGFGTLAFLITFFALVAALILVLFNLARRRPRTAWKIGRVMLAWTGVYAILLLGVSLSSRAPVLEQGQEHCFDEMCFSVQEIITAPALGTGEAQVNAQGIFYVITVELHSASRRTPQKPSNPHIWVIDAQGGSYTRMVSAGDPAGQPLDPARLWDRKVQPGEKVDRVVAFDLPMKAGLAPSLVITEGSGFPTDLIIGDENSFFHAKTTFRLALLERMRPQRSP